MGAVSAGEWLGVSEGFKCLLMADELPTPSPADYANFTIPKSIIKDYTWVAMESHVEMENLLRCFCVIVLLPTMPTSQYQSQSSKITNGRATSGLQSHVQMENLLRCFCVIVLVQVLAFQTALLVC